MIILRNKIKGSVKFYKDGRVSASHPVKTEIGTCDYTYVTPLLGTKHSPV